VADPRRCDALSVRDVDDPLHCRGRGSRQQVPAELLETAWNQQYGSGKWDGGDDTLFQGISSLAADTCEATTYAPK
jgi:hypothetical protein